MIDNEPPREAIAPLQVWPTITEAYARLFGNIPTLLKLAAIPMALSMWIDIMTGPMEGPFARVVRAFLLELPWVLLGVAWLRQVLQVDEASKLRFFPVLQRRHLQFLLYSLLLSCIDLPLLFYPVDGAAAEEPILQAAFWGLYLLTVYLEMRFAFVYVTTAVDENYSLGLAWRHSRGPALRLFLVICLAVLLPWRAFVFLLEGVAESDDVAIFAWVFWHAGLWLLQAAYLTILAIAFRTCTGWVPPPDAKLLKRFE